MDTKRVVTSALDRDVEVLGSRHRRLVLAYLLQEPTNTASISDLTEYIVAHSAGEPIPTRETIPIELYHKDLPKLADYGLVEFDVEAKMVRYTSHDRIERLLKCVPGE